jgi:hypothetical protein
MIILPRQARDKHRESTQKRVALSHSMMWRTRRIESRLQVRKTRILSFVMPFCIESVSVYQDKLGTNIGKALKKRPMRFLRSLVSLQVLPDSPVSLGHATAEVSKRGRALRAAGVSGKAGVGSRSALSRGSAGRANPENRGSCSGTCSGEYVCHASQVQTGWSPHAERSFER